MTDSCAIRERQCLFPRHQRTPSPPLHDDDDDDEEEEEEEEGEGEKKKKKKKKKFQFNSIQFKILFIEGRT